MRFCAIKQIGIIQKQSCEEQQRKMLMARFLKLYRNDFRDIA